MSPGHSQVRDGELIISAVGGGTRFKILILANSLRNQARWRGVANRDGYKRIDDKNRS